MIIATIKPEKQESTLVRAAKLAPDYLLVNETSHSEHWKAIARQEAQWRNELRTGLSQGRLG